MITCFIATSLDGFIAKKNGKVDWLFTDQDYGYNEFIKNIDLILMGNKTYQQILTFGEWPYKQPTFIASRTPQETNHATNIQDPVQFVKDNNDKKIWLVGGETLISLCIKEKLLDSLIVALHPICLGEGIPLTKAFSKLTLKDTKTYETGLVQLTYDLNE